MNEFRVGLMAIATMAAVVYMSFRVTSNQSGFGSHVKYRTIVDDASGIFPKTPIKVAGIVAGRIKGIELSGNQALITFDILEDVVITPDTKIRIKSVGFLGDKYIDIQIGKLEGRLPENSFIKAEIAGSLEKLVKDASDAMKDVRSIVDGLKKSLAPDGEEPPIKQIVSDVSELVKNAKTVTESLKKVITGNEERIDNIVKNLEKFSSNLKAQLDKDNPESTLSDVKEILNNTKEMTADLKEMVANVKNGKGTIGKLLVEEDIADQVTETLSGVNKLVNKANSVRSEFTFLTGANTRWGAESVGYYRIFPSPERFYHFGISTSEFGPEREKRTTLINNGVVNNQIERTKVKNQFRFDFQLGRVINNWVIRGGLIESTGGLGVDYMLERWATVFTLETFDVRDDIGPNLRFAARFQIWNVFFGRIAGEDLLEETGRGATFSAGLRFSDEDIKGLIGLFL